jgi:hypothetical protein
VKLGAVDELVAFSRIPTTPLNTLKLILRTLAVLCGTSKGEIFESKIKIMNFFLKNN